MLRAGGAMAAGRESVRIGSATLRKLGGFTQVPNLLLKDRHLSSSAKCLWAVLLSYGWGTSEVFPGQKRAGEKIGVKVRQARRLIAELEEAGWIRVEQRGGNQTNVYHLLLPLDGPVKNDRGDRSKMSGPDGVYPLLEEDEEKEDIREKGKKEEEKEKERSDEEIDPSPNGCPRCAHTHAMGGKCTCACHGVGDPKLKRESKKDKKVGGRNKKRSGLNGRYPESRKLPTVTLPEWFGQFEEIYARYTGGMLTNPDQVVEAIGAMLEKSELDEVLRRWEYFCETTDPRFLSARYFASRPKAFKVPKGWKATGEFQEPQRRKKGESGDGLTPGQRAAAEFRKKQEQKEK